MKNQINKYLTLASASLLALGFAAQQAYATPTITGSISFAGNATVVDNTPGVFSTAKAFTAISADVTGASGAYASLLTDLNLILPGSLTSTGSAAEPAGGAPAFLGGSAGLMSDYTFNPAQGAVTPLWAFTEGTTAYSFNATTMTAHYDAATQIWDIGGLGTASITGFTTTAGTWNADVGMQGASFFFGSAATISGVPDGGLTVALLGGMIVGLGAFRRKFGC